MRLRQQFHEQSEQHIQSLMNDGECPQCGAVTAWVTRDVLVIVPGDVSSLTVD